MSNVAPEQIDWTKDPFKSVNDAVTAEAKQIAVGALFLPPYGPIDETAKSVPSDIITINSTTPLAVAESDTTAVLEVDVEFTLTQQQYDEEHLDTAVTLATRAANLLAQAQDLLIFQGFAATEQPFFKNNPVSFKNAGQELRGLVTPAPADVVTVALKAEAPGGRSYGENTSTAVAKAYSLLQSKGHYGPYALALQTDPFADTLAPLANTLIMPADRIKPLVTETDSQTGKQEVRFYGTGTLPAFTGVLVSLGGNTMDLVSAAAPRTQWTTRNARLLVFSVFQRFTLRLKDPTAVVSLNFAKP
jgi:uncharacterized linocin/CFP29 family protein